MLVLNRKPLSSSGSTRGSRLSGRTERSTVSLSYSGVSRVSTEECFVWILGTSPRMTENGVFRSDSNFSQKWRKPRVKALKRSEIECLGFTERERETF